MGAFTLASLLFGLLAVALAYRFTGSAVACVGVLVATPLPYYLAYEPSYSHTFSAFAVTLFLLAWWRGREARGPAGWFLLGLLGGLMALVRYQDGPLLAIVLLDLPRARWKLLLMVPGVLLAFAPQLVVDRVVFGTWLPERPAGQDLQPFSGHYLDVLFSSWHGLFAWHPLTLLAAAGFLFVRERALQVAFVYALVVETLINAAAPDWWGGFAFGARRFLDLTPFFVIGLAALARRVGERPAWAAVALLGVWNLLLMANFTYVIRTDHDPGYLGLLGGQAAAVGHLPNLFAQGVVGRDLLLWPLLHQPFQPLAGIAFVLLEAACLYAARRVAG